MGLRLHQFLRVFATSTFRSDSLENRDRIIKEIASVNREVLVLAGFGFGAGDLSDRGCCGSGGLFAIWGDDQPIGVGYGKKYAAFLTSVSALMVQFYRWSRNVGADHYPSDAEAQPEADVFCVCQVQV